MKKSILNKENIFPQSFDLQKEQKYKIRFRTSKQNNIIFDIKKSKRDITFTLFKELILLFKKKFDYLLKYFELQVLGT